MKELFGSSMKSQTFPGTGPGLLEEREEEEEEEDEEGEETHSVSGDRGVSR